MAVEWGKALRNTESYKQESEGSCFVMVSGADVRVMSAFKLPIL